MMRWLALLIIVCAASAWAQYPGPVTAFPGPLTNTACSSSACVFGADPPQNPTWQAGIGGDPSVYQFCWTTTNAQQGRVIVGTYSTSPYRWVDNPTPSTNMCITVDHIYPGHDYGFGFASCPTWSDCDQIDTNELNAGGQPSCAPAPPAGQPTNLCGWSGWNVTLGISTCGKTPPANAGCGRITPPIAPTGTTPSWRVIPIVTSTRLYNYANGYINGDLEYLFRQMPADYSSNSIEGAVSWSVTDSSNTVYTCPTSVHVNASGVAISPVITLNTIDPVQTGTCKSTTSADSHLKVMTWEWTSGNLSNLPYVFRVSKAAWNQTLDPKIQNLDRVGYTGYIQTWGQSVNGSAGAANRNDTFGIFTDGSTAPGTYTITGRVQLFYNRGTSSVPTSYSCTEQSTSDPSLATSWGCNYAYFTIPITVVAPTATVITAPSSYPPEPYLGFFNPHIIIFSAQDCHLFQLWNAKGGWINHQLNGNQSGNGWIPDNIWNYDGGRVRWQLADYLANDPLVSTTWQANHAYNLGDMFRTGGVTYIVMTAGTSGTTAPNWATNAPWMTVFTDGTAQWGSAGQNSDWNNCGYQVRQQYDNWYGNAPLASSGGVIGEWNTYPFGALINWARQTPPATTPACTYTDNGTRFVVSTSTDVQSRDWCGTGAGTCKGYSCQTLLNIGDPRQSNLIAGIMHATAPGSTVRTMPYTLDQLTTFWAVSATRPPIWDQAKNMLLDQVDMWDNYSPYDSHACCYSSNPAPQIVNTQGRADFPRGTLEYACCFGAPSFDIGLAEEALYAAYIQEKRAGLTPDPRIEPTVKAVLNKMWSYYIKGTAHGNTFNAGLYSPYWLTTNGAVGFSNNFLNGLIAVGMAWIWRMEGDSCVLQNGPSNSISGGSTDTCLQVHDFMLTHLWDGMSPWAGYGKQDNELYKSWMDDHMWRSGQLTPDASVLFPEHQPQLATYPSTIPPYQIATNYANVTLQYPIASTNNVNNTVTITWNTYEKVTSVSIQFGANKTTASGALSPCGATLTSTIKTTGVGVWNNVCTVAIPSGYAVGTTVFYSMSSTNASGLTTTPTFSPQLSYTSPITNTTGYYCLANGAATGYSTNSCNANGSFVVPSPPPTTSSIAGTITDSASIALTGVLVSLSGTSTASVTTGTAGTYSFTNLANGSYTVTPTRSGYTFVPNVLTYTITTPTAYTGQNFTGSTGTPPPTYSISGTISGAVASGISVQLTGAGTGQTYTDANGDYSFTGYVAGTYIVTPVLSGYLFTPANITVTVSNANVTGQNFTSAPVPPPQTYTISGSVSGAVLQGVTVSMTGAATSTTSTDTFGSYSFTVVPGAYTITPTLSGYTFSPASAAVTVATANVSGTNFLAIQVPPSGPTNTRWGASLITGPGRGPIPPIPPGPPGVYAVTGTIQGATCYIGVTVTLAGPTVQTRVTGGNGAYSFSDVPTGTYTVTPSLVGCGFAPQSKTIQVVDRNLFGVSFISSPGLGRRQDRREDRREDRQH